MKIPERTFTMVPQVTRRRALGALVYGTIGTVATLSMVAGDRRAARAADPIRVGISQPTYSFIPLDIGIEKGFFTKHGVAIEKTVFDGSAKLHQAIAAGAIDIGLGAGPEFGFLVKGAPEKAVAASADAPYDMTITVAKNGPIKTVQDLKGQKVSCSTKGSLSEWGGRVVSEHEGWGPDGIQMVALGSFNAQTAALETNQIVGMVVDVATAGRLVESGQGRIVTRVASFVPYFHIHVTFASDDYIKNHPDQIRGFLAGWNDTIAYMKTHKADSNAIAVKVLNLSPSLASSVYDDLMPAFNPTGRFNQKALDTLALALVQTGELPTKPDLKPYYTEEFLPSSKS
jgi:NitT/TauT family transport system substrate-binding protein